MRENRSEFVANENMGRVSGLRRAQIVQAEPDMPWGWIAMCAGCLGLWAWIGYKVVTLLTGGPL